MVKVTTQSIRALKNVRPIVALTAYDVITASLADRAGVDLILVGDSVGTTLLGFDTTLPVTLDMMLHHTAAVARAHPKALLVSDLPFPESGHDFGRLLESCGRLVQEAGAEAVKIEGGINSAPRISRLVEAGIPVLGHIGLLPQRYLEIGGYRKFGKSGEEKKQLQADADALQQAGVFAIIGEMIEPALAAQISSSLQVPFIGIGCGPDCDGQILVSTDLLGLNLSEPPSFVKTYANLAESVEQAMAQYADEVRERKFPQ